MTPTQKIFSLVVCALVFLFVIYLVRARRLRKEDSLLWLASSCFMLLLVVKYDWLVLLTRLSGAVPTTTLFICSNVFLMLIAMRFSIKVSKMTDQVKNLIQENALLQSRLSDCEKRIGQQ